MINGFDGVVVLALLACCLTAAKVPVVVNFFGVLGCVAGLYLAGHYPTVSENGIAGVFLGFAVAGLLLGIFVNRVLSIPFPDIVQRLFGYLVGVVTAACILLVLVIPIAGRLSARNRKTVNHSWSHGKIIVPAQKRYPLIKTFSIDNFKEAGLPGIMKSLGFDTEPTTKVIQKSKQRMYRDWERAEKVNPE